MQEQVPLTEEEAMRRKGDKDDINGDKDDAIKQIGTVNPIDDFKKMISDR